MERLDVARELAEVLNAGHVRVRIVDKDGNYSDAVLLHIDWEIASDSIGLEVQSEEDNLAMQEREAERA